MKKFLLFILPLLLAVLVFFILIFFFKFSPSGKGSLQVTSRPVSQVYLDGKPIGQTPLCKCAPQTMFASGDYTVKLIPKGDFKPFEQKITINKGTLTVVDSTFAAGATEGSVITLSPLNNKQDIELLVISFPDKSDVFLDNNPAGQTPILFKNITESDHDLKISKDGYKDKLIKISTHLGYKLSSIVYLGINPVVLNTQNSLASSSATLSVQKVFIQSPVGYVNVRDSGSLAGIKIGKVYSDDTFDLIDEQDGWFKIKLQDGTVGWIDSAYAVKK